MISALFLSDKISRQNNELLSAQSDRLHVLQAALQAAIGAFQDSMWERRVLELAAGFAAAGCSPVGGLEAVKSISATCKRGRFLQRHALAALLKRAIPSQARPLQYV